LLYTLHHQYHGGIGIVAHGERNGGIGGINDGVAAAANRKITKIMA